MSENGHSPADDRRELSHRRGQVPPGITETSPWDMKDALVLRTPAPAVTRQPTATSPRALLSALRRRWVTAIGAGLCMAAAAASAVWMLMPAPYTAFSELRINSIQERILFKTAEEQASFATYKQTQMRLVKSPFVFSAALRNPEVVNLSIVREQSRPLDWLEDKIVVSTPASEFLRIELSGEQPEELATLINAITHAYMDEVVNDEQNKRRERLTSLERINRGLEEQLHTKRHAMRRLAETLNTSDSETLTMKQQMALEFYSQVRKEASQMRFELTRAKVQLAAKQAGTALPDDINIPESVIDAQIVQNLEFVRMMDRVSQLNTLIAKYEQAAGRHPAIRTYREELQRTEEGMEALRTRLRPQVVNALRTEYAARAQASEAELEEKVKLLSAELAQLEQELETQTIEQKNTGIMSFELGALSKEIAQSEAISKSISDEIKRLQIELRSPLRITLHQAAEVPYLRNSQPKIQVTALAGVGMFGLVVGAIVLLEVQARRVSSMDEVVDELQMRVVGSLPLMPRWMTNRRIGSDANPRTEFWHNILTESIDSARTLLLRDTNQEEMNVVMVSSAMEGEGKTTLACHLSTSLARAGRKTLLLDGDMRRPSVNRVFDLPLGPGLCEVLRGEASIDETIHPGPTEGLFIMPAGQIDQRVLQILAQDGLESILAQLRERFDFVIADSSPVLPVTDALLLAQHVDAVIFSIRRDVSRCAKVTAACQRLTMLGVPLLGAVAIGLDEGSFRYPHSYAYGGYGHRPPPKQQARAGAVE